MIILFVAGIILGVNVVETQDYDKCVKVNFKTSFCQTEQKLCKLDRKNSDAFCGLK